MYRIILAGLVLAFVLADCDCGDGATGPDDGDTKPPIDTVDTSSTADIDTLLIGTWHQYNAASPTQLLARNYVRVTDSSITVGIQPPLVGVRDSNPQFAKDLIARGGQIYFRPDSGCTTGCANEYLYDYALGPGDSVLYLVAEYSETATNPSLSTPDVILLRRDTISATTDLNLISDTLVGRWNLYDSTGSVLVQASYLVVTADSIVLQGIVVFKGYFDPGGNTGRTLVARNGQLWYDYHWEEQPDIYRFDYMVAPGGTTMYWLQEETSAYTQPDQVTLNVKILKK